MKMFHVKAWGSNDCPDLDYETDDIPSNLTSHYPMVSINRRHPINLADVMATLDIAIDTLTLG